MLLHFMHSKCHIQVPWQQTMEILASGGKTGRNAVADAHTYLQTIVHRDRHTAGKARTERDAVLLQSPCVLIYSRLEFNFKLNCQHVGNFQLDSLYFHNFLVTDLLSPISTANPSAKCSLFPLAVTIRSADLQHIMWRKPRKHSTILTFTPNGA